jgi:hypothetical protein
MDFNVQREEVFGFRNFPARSVKTEKIFDRISVQDRLRPFLGPRQKFLR